MYYKVTGLVAVTRIGTARASTARYPSMTISPLPTTHRLILLLLADPEGGDLLDATLVVDASDVAMARTAPEGRTANGTRAHRMMSRAFQKVPTRVSVVVLAKHGVDFVRGVILAASTSTIEQAIVVTCAVDP